MEIYSKTDTGSVRKNNQDAFAHGVVNDELAWAAVCDGMGGANGGDYASKTAIGVMTNVIAHGLTGEPDTEALKNLLAAAIGGANISVYDASKVDSSLAGMGTTAVAAIVSGNQLVVAHSGDSRAYLLDRTTITQITVDHSVVQEMVDNGEITEEEARNHPRRNLITRALGVADRIEIDFNVVDIHPDQAVLLCSDGLTNYVTDEDILNSFNNIDPEALPARLVDMANANGGGDNITVVVMNGRNVR